MDYKKTGVSKERIVEYIKSNPTAQDKEYFSKAENLNESLGRLEKIHSIMLENGCYHVTETILN